ncbi:MAG TPA: hypothetical protein G4O15_08420 [Dehalococcoidia bacterium]|nr:hypothetical protein [Dehalococcoidia bacterium]
MTNFRKALLFTATPPTLLVIAAVCALLPYPPPVAFNGPLVGDVLAVVSSGFVIASFLASIYFVIRRNKELAKATVIGGIIGAVVWMIGLGIGEMLVD